MRLFCPYCGERDHSEFIYRGDATIRRPDPEAAGAANAFHDYVYQRDNPAGWHREHWYHEGGCRSWIVVERNTVTHRIRSSALPDSEENDRTSAGIDPGRDGEA